MMRQIIYFIAASVLLLQSCKSDGDAPVITSVNPTFAPVESLIVVEGQNLENIREIYFSDQLVNFNTAYNSDNALLLRVPTNVPVAQHVVRVVTSGGETTFDFRVAKDAPFVDEFLPESGSVGDEITLYGENFFEPIEVYFFDSIQAEIVQLTVDSVVVLVPEGTEKGRITMNANGGQFTTSKNFFIATNTLVNNFDGSGMRSETANWLRAGFVDQPNAMSAVTNSNPTPIDGSFLKITGTDALEINWIGGFENNSNDTDVFDTFNLTTDISNTLLEFDVNNNGATDTYLSVVLLERDGSNNDFTESFKIDGNGWDKISAPLSRFLDLDGFTIDPAKVKAIKFHILDQDGTGNLLEANIDNVQFIEIE